MTDIEKVIETMKGLCLCGNCTTPSIKGFERCADCNRYKAKQLTIQALQEKAEREKNLPLTLKELQEMDGQPCYVVDMEPYGWENNWYLIDVATETVYNQDRCYLFKNIIGFAYHFKKEDESNEL